LNREVIKLAKKKEQSEYGYCYQCKEYDDTLVKRPCKFRDFADFTNMCLSYSLDRKRYQYREEAR
jgi:hypothetical protein